MSSPPRVLAVVLNWNGYALAVDCLAHLERQTYPRLEVLVIDNGSTDNSPQRLAELHGIRCTVLALHHNQGFAGGMNVGIRQAVAGGYDYVWLLNNDAFAEPECLSFLVQAMQTDPALALVTPRLYGTDGIEQHAGGRLDWTTGHSEELLSKQMATPVPHGDWLTGTALLVRPGVAAEAGMFDAAFFAYCEDVDLCVRLTARGYHLRAVPEAHCLHLGGCSSGGAESPFGAYMGTRNPWLVLRKHLRGNRRRGPLLAVFAAGLTRAASMVRYGKEPLASAILSALYAIIQNRYGPPQSLEVPPLVRRLVMWQWWRIVKLLNLCRALRA